MKNNLFLFDYDGVLVDSLAFNLSVVGDVLKEMGYRDFPTVEFCRDSECISFESWARKIGLPESDIPEYVRRIHCGVVAGAPELKIFSGVKEMLEILSERAQLGVITASTSLAAKTFLEKHAIFKYFADVVGADSSGNKAEKIKSLSAKHNFYLSQVIYIGDSGTDVQQGKLAGVRTVAVTWGFQGRERLMREKPDYLVECPEEIARIASA